MTRPDYAGSGLSSFCDYGQPLTVMNRGIFDTGAAGGDLLLAAHLSKQPVENFLAFHSLRLEYMPEAGLQVTLVGLRGDEQTEEIPAEWIRCTEHAMEIVLPSDAFYVWASVGVKSRRLELMVGPEHSLVLRNAWEEKGMAAVIFPLKFKGDGWASFSAVDRVEFEATPEISIAAVGACQDLSGEYVADGTSIRLDGSMAIRTAGTQFFRPEIMGELAPADADTAVAFTLAHSAGTGAEFALLSQEGPLAVRHLEPADMSCEQGRWFVKGKKDAMPAIMLLFGSGGATWEDLVLWRDTDGALLLRGTYRSRGAVFLIPTGVTSEIFVRYDLVQHPMPDNGGADDLVPIDD